MVLGIKDLSLNGAASAPESRMSHAAWGDPKGPFRPGHVGCDVAAADGTVGHTKGNGCWQHGTGRCPWAGGTCEGGRQVFVL